MFDPDLLGMDAGMQTLLLWQMQEQQAEALRLQQLQQLNPGPAKGWEEIADEAAENKRKNQEARKRLGMPPLPE